MQSSGPLHLLSHIVRFFVSSALALRERTISVEYEGALKMGSNSVKGQGVGHNCLSFASHVSEMKSSMSFCKERTLVILSKIFCDSGDLLS